MKAEEGAGLVPWEPCGGQSREDWVVWMIGRMQTPGLDGAKDQVRRARTQWRGSGMIGNPMQTRRQKSADASTIIVVQHARVRQITTATQSRLRGWQRARRCPKAIDRCAYGATLASPNHAMEGLK